MQVHTRCVGEHEQGSEQYDLDAMTQRCVHAHSTGVVFLHRCTSHVQDR